MKNKFKITEALLNKNYEFRINLVTCRADFKKKKDKQFRVLDDIELNSILRFMRQSAPSITKQNLQQIISSDFSKKYDPIKEYFNSLPEYDGSKDYIAELANTITVENHEFWNRCLQKWIVAAVASIIREDVNNDQTIILTSSQGLGKTRWIERLVPMVLKPYFYSGNIDPKNKDSHFLLSECFLIDMDEMVGLTPSKNEALKHLLTKSSIKARRQYDTYHNDFIRRANFIASTNKEKFIQDSTGSRRFLCFRPQSINYSHNINMDNVFSQAIALLNSDYKFWFTPHELFEIHQNNKTYEYVSQVEQNIMESYEPSTKASNGEFMSTTEIAIELYGIDIKNDNQSLLRSLGLAMTKLGFQKSKKGYQHGYYLIRLL